MVKSFKTYVLGASLNPQRYSNKAILMLKRFKIPTVAFGIKEGLAHGVKIESDLINYNDIHTVTIYLSPNNQKSYIDHVISLNPKRIIFNPGTENHYFSQILMSKNIYFESACTLVLLSTNQYKTDKGNKTIQGE